MIVTDRPFAVVAHLHWKVCRVLCRMQGDCMISRYAKGPAVGSAEHSG